MTEPTNPFLGHERRRWCARVVDLRGTLVSYAGVSP